jgi:hypothetical protein
MVIEGDAHDTSQATFSKFPIYLIFKDKIFIVKIS